MDRYTSVHTHYSFKNSNLTSCSEQLYVCSQIIATFNNYSSTDMFDSIDCN